MKRILLLAVALALVPLAAGAAPATWLTDDAIGPNEVDFRVQLTCPAPSLVCSLVDGYDDTQTSSTAGAGTFDIDVDADTIQFDTDSTQDVGSGPQAAYLTLAGTDMTFANIPFAGVPEIANVLVFALTSPPISAPGVHLQAPGDYPFSETLSYSGLADVIGDLEFILPGIVVPPDDVLLSGVLRVLGDVDMDGFTEIELRGVTGTFSFQNLTTISGESVTVDVTADVEMNLAAETAAPPAPPPPPVPALGPGSLLVLSSLLLASGLAARSC